MVDKKHPNRARKYHKRYFRSIPQYSRYIPSNSPHAHPPLLQHTCRQRRLANHNLFDLSSIQNRHTPLQPPHSFDSSALITVSSRRPSSHHREHKIQHQQPQQSSPLHQHLNEEQSRHYNFQSIFTTPTQQLKPSLYQHHIFSQQAGLRVSSLYDHSPSRLHTQQHRHGGSMSPLNTRIIPNRTLTTLPTLLLSTAQRTTRTISVLTSTTATNSSATIPILTIAKRGRKYRGRRTKLSRTKFGGFLYARKPKRSTRHKFRRAWNEYQNRMRIDAIRESRDLQLLKPTEYEIPRFTPSEYELIAWEERQYVEELGKQFPDKLDEMRLKLERKLRKRAVSEGKKISRRKKLGGDEPTSDSEYLNLELNPFNVRKPKLGRVKKFQGKYDKPIRRYDEFGKLVEDKNETTVDHGDPLGSSEDVGGAFIKDYFHGPFGNDSVPDTDDKEMFRLEYDDADFDEGGKRLPTDWKKLKKEEREMMQYFTKNPDGSRNQKNYDINYGPHVMKATVAIRDFWAQYVKQREQKSKTKQKHTFVWDQYGSDRAFIHALRRSFETSSARKARHALEKDEQGENYQPSDTEYKSASDSPVMGRSKVSISDLPSGVIDTWAANGFSAVAHGFDPFFRREKVEWILRWPTRDGRPPIPPNQPPGLVPASKPYTDEGLSDFYEWTERDCKVPGVPRPWGTEEERNWEDWGETDAPEHMIEQLWDPDKVESESDRDLLDPTTAQEDRSYAEIWGGIRIQKPKRMSRGVEVLPRSPGQLPMDKVEFHNRDVVGLPGRYGYDRLSPSFNKNALDDMVDPLMLAQGHDMEDLFNQFQPFYNPKYHQLDMEKAFATDPPSDMFISLGNHAYPKESVGLDVAEYENYRDAVFQDIEDNHNILLTQEFENWRTVLEDQIVQDLDHPVTMGTNSIDHNPDDKGGKIPLHLDDQGPPRPLRSGQEAQKQKPVWYQELLEKYKSYRMLYPDAGVRHSQTLVDVRQDQIASKEQRSARRALQKKIDLAAGKPPKSEDEETPDTSEESLDTGWERNYSETVEELPSLPLVRPGKPPPGAAPLLTKSEDQELELKEFIDHADQHYAYEKAIYDSFSRHLASRPTMEQLVQSDQDFHFVDPAKSLSETDSDRALDDVVLANHHRRRVEKNIDNIRYREKVVKPAKHANIVRNLSESDVIDGSYNDIDDDDVDNSELAAISGPLNFEDVSQNREITPPALQRKIDKYNKIYTKLKNARKRQYTHKTYGEWIEVDFQKRRRQQELERRKNRRGLYPGEFPTSENTTDLIASDKTEYESDLSFIEGDDTDAKEAKRLARAQRDLSINDHLLSHRRDRYGPIPSDADTVDMTTDTENPTRFRNRDDDDYRRDAETGILAENVRKVLRLAGETGPEVQALLLQEKQEAQEALERLVERMQDEGTLDSDAKEEFELLWSAAELSTDPDAGLNEAKRTIELVRQRKSYEEAKKAGKIPKDECTDTDDMSPEQRFFHLQEKRKTLREQHYLEEMRKEADPRKEIYGLPTDLDSSDYVPSENAQFEDKEMSHYYFLKQVNYMQNTLTLSNTGGIGHQYTRAEASERPEPTLPNPKRHDNEETRLHGGDLPQLHPYPEQILPTISDTLTVAERAQKHFLGKLEEYKLNKQQLHDQTISQILHKHYGDALGQPPTLSLVINPLHPTMHQLRQQYRHRLLRSYVPPDDFDRNHHLLDEIGATADGTDPLFQQYISRVVDRFKLDPIRLKDFGIIKMSKIPEETLQPAQEDYMGPSGQGDFDLDQFLRQHQEQQQQQQQQQQQSYGNEQDYGQYGGQHHDQHDGQDDYQHNGEENEYEEEGGDGEEEEFWDPRDPDPENPYHAWEPDDPSPENPWHAWRAMEEENAGSPDQYDHTGPSPQGHPSDQNYGGNLSYEQEYSQPDQNDSENPPPDDSGGRSKSQKKKTDDHQDGYIFDHEGYSIPSSDEVGPKDPKTPQRTPWFYDSDTEEFIKDLRSKDPEAFMERWGSGKKEGPSAERDAAILDELKRLSPFLKKKDDKNKQQ